jgi:anti-anti-sigma factor
MQTVVMIFTGEYDLTSKERLRETLEELCAVPSVILNFSDVTYVDSTVITELIRMHNLRAERGFASEAIVLQNRNVRQVLDLLQMQQIFRFFEALDDAVGPTDWPLTVRYAFAGSEGSASKTLDQVG